MLGSYESKTGTSLWIGADMDGFGDNDRWGVNFVLGSKYYRPFTWGEDTLIGSIAATRGTAYDIYYNHPLMEHLTVGARFTYINYNYTGSNGFFGDTGAPVNVDLMPTAVQAAKDFRAYIRYKF
jgi:hypothetical protein